MWRERLAVGFALIAPVILAGVGTMRRGPFLLWTLIACALVAIVLGSVPVTLTRHSFNFEGHYLLLIPFLFVAHELVSSADIARKRVAPYSVYFDEGTKRGVQLALALLFTGLFWGILQLGSALLGFIGFTWLEWLLRRSYFSFPITGIAFAAAVHLGDVQNKMLANVRALILGVLSWLLPVLTLIGVIFAGSLLFSGLAKLWATKAATVTLLGGCIGFGLLINAAYQQGDEERQVSPILKWCVRCASILMLVFAVLAAWSLGLRIEQHGLSPDRILAGVGVFIALGFGLGYGVAVFVPGRWMARLEPVNIGLAMLTCAVFFAVLTPIASPWRLSVNDQVARLIDGKVSVDRFDWWLLKDKTGTYGRKALDMLATSQNRVIADKAKLALDGKIGNLPYFESDASNRRPVTRADLEALPVVFPVGAKLPESFLETNFLATEENGMSWNDCLPISCKFALLDLTRDGQAEVLLREDMQIAVFTQVGDKWQRGAQIFAPALEEAFDAGRLSAVPSSWDDIQIGDQVRGVNEIENAIGEMVPNIKEPPKAPPPPKTPPPPSK
jgi:Domain of unknown function (DUF4153)